MIAAAPAPTGAQKALRVPWYIWLAPLAVTFAIIGIQWDISWHRSIGRDAFFTPAHIAIYLCGVLAAICCGYLIFSTTFTNSPLRSASVSVWGFRAPLGAFVAAWGGLVMLASAPFDDWWHGAYGLDVKILSPPHVVLALGIFAIEAGAVLLVAGQRNRSGASAATLLDRVFLYVGGLAVLLLMSVTMEYSGIPMQHTSIFYQAMAITVPFAFALVSAGSRSRWACTAAAAVYTGVMLGMVWILPLFPAQPKLGPVYNEVTHFVPPAFPLLLLVPAIALDLFFSRFSTLGPWKKALIAGPLFLLVFIAAQWPFADFLQSPAAPNAIFRNSDYDYLSPPTSAQVRHVFYRPDPTVWGFWWRFALAAVFATLGVRTGLNRGAWIQKIQR